MNLLRALLLAMPLLLAGVVRAEPPPTGPMRAAADPNAARFGLMFRGSMRAQLGATLPLLEGEHAEGFALSLSPLVELHEPMGSDQLLPSQYWRARVGLAWSYGWRGEQQRYRLTLALEHESDHETAHEYSAPGFLTQNSLALAFGGEWRLGALRLGVTPAVMLYVVSCTRAREQCSDFRGDASIGTQLDLMIDMPTSDVGALTPFLSAHGATVVGHGQVRSEHRLELHAGAWYATTALLFQAFALAYLGNDIGITRNQRVTQLGLGTSLSLR